MSQLTEIILAEQCCKCVTTPQLPVLLSDKCSTWYVMTLHNNILFEILFITKHNYVDFHKYQ